MHMFLLKGGERDGTTAQVNLWMHALCVGHVRRSESWQARNKLQVLLATRYIFAENYLFRSVSYPVRQVGFDGQEECGLEGFVFPWQPILWVFLSKQSGAVFFPYRFHTSLFKRSNRLVPKCTWKRANSAPILHHSDLLLSRHTHRQTHAHLLLMQSKHADPKDVFSMILWHWRRKIEAWNNKKGVASLDVDSVERSLVALKCADLFGRRWKKFWHFDKVLFKSRTCWIKCGWRAQFIVPLMPHFRHSAPLFKLYTCAGSDAWKNWSRRPWESLKSS